MIKELNKTTYQPPRYKNNFEKLTASFAPVYKGEAMANGMAATGALAGGGPDYVMDAPQEKPSVDQKGDSSYQEVTDNQVEGVIEADIFKRSDKYIYHLTPKQTLNIYTIAKDESKLVGKYDLNRDGSVKSYGTEMYLSQDCTTISLVMPGWDWEHGARTTLISLDVTDPTNIREVKTVYFPGSYISSRMVNDQILLAYLYEINRSQIDFDQPETFVPVYGEKDEMNPVDGADIVCPENPTSTRYSVVAKLDSKTMEVLDTEALLSYSQNLYVSQSTVFATYSYTKNTINSDGTVNSRVMTEITGVSYEGDELTVLGSVCVEGNVKDQYSMDQQENILRVATSTRETVRREYSNGSVTWVENSNRKDNCNLYCIDLTNWDVVASVLAFAPEGEKVTSARFDGDHAYICTAEVVIMTDPVYFFDLSDLSNIRYKHTPVIDGYSSSLIQFGDFLLGIGMNEKREMKREVYKEAADSVTPVASYERPCSYSDVYKSYFIDRENCLIGLAVMDWDTGRMNYLLLHFDGYQFRVLSETPVYGGLEQTRADLIDGWLYLLHTELNVMPIFG